MLRSITTTTSTAGLRRTRELYFADTFYWIALTNPKDDAHRQVMRFTAGLPPPSVVTSDEVLTELLAYCAGDPKVGGLNRLRIRRIALERLQE